MQGIPVTKDTDAEDVVWGLQTADALWKRGERADALVWLRRAAQAAGDATDDDRALELARAAAELAEFLNQHPSIAPTMGVTSALTVAPTGARQEEPSIEIDVTPSLLPPLPGPEPEPRAPVFRSDPPSSTRVPSVPPAEKVHAGMFDPWAESQRKPSAAPPPPVVPSDPPASSGEDQVFTSVPPAAGSASNIIPPERRSQRVLPPPGAPPSEPGMRAMAKLTGSSKPPGDAPQHVAPRIPKPPPLPPRAFAKPPKPPAPRAPSSHNITNIPAPATAHHPSHQDLEAAVASEPDPSPPTPVPPSPTQQMLQPAPYIAPEPVVAQAAPILDLENVEAFADLPDDARIAFAAAAKVSTLAESEEVSSFALAYVITGALDVASMLVDAPAFRLRAGNVLRSRGTTDEGVPMRLIGGSSEAIVATWSDAAVEQAFKSIPWVEEDLRAAADKVQTLVGITIGPLGERLDASIREEIVGKLQMRPLLAGEIVVKQGDTVPGLLLVGVGEIEIVQDDVVKSTVSSGDFLFAGEVLGMGNAPATARAGAGGALVLFGDRRIAQELLVTCPPLLEVFAGM